MKFNDKTPIWSERYRPTVLKECILKKSVAKEMANIVETDTMPNMILHGPPGSGKTTTARALCNEMGLDWILINTSNERGIDTLREKITNFASTVSMTGSSRKCVIMDEFDYATMNLMTAMRSATEDFSKSCSFILTANYPNRIIPALHSRFVSVDFGADKKELEEMQAKMFMRVVDILDNEKVEYDDLALVTLVKKLFPDNRKILGVLQQFSRHGKIDEGALMGLDEMSIDTLITTIKSKKAKSIFQWAEDQKDNDTSSMYENIYKRIKDFVEPSSIPDVIMILEDYQRYDATVPSKELHLSSMCIEIMSTIEFL